MLPGPDEFEPEEIRSEEIKADQAAEAPAKDLRSTSAQRSADDPAAEADESQRADEAAQLPVQEEEADRADRTAALPVEEDDAQRPDDIAARLPVAEDEASQPIEDKEGPDEADTLAAPGGEPEVADRPEVLPVEEHDAPQSDRLAVLRADEQRAQESIAELRIDVADSPPLPEPERFEDLAEHIDEATAGQDRVSPADVEGYTAEENAEIADELDHVERAELHHAVPVAAARAMAFEDAGRAESLRGPSDAAREIVDELFREQADRVALEEGVHEDLHKALKVELALQRVADDQKLHDALEIALNAPRRDDLPEGSALREDFEAAVDKLIADDDRLRDAVAQERADYGTSEYARDILERLHDQEVSTEQLVDEYEAAYRQVFEKHPGLVAEEQQAQLLAHVDAVRDRLRLGLS